ncbi:MAG: glycosyltransferase, partial [Candidatus Thermoplasmatota archaeon]|nr:glycosyltransferase [Candidatus Thermoplasmatota archaeon]
MEKKLGMCMLAYEEGSEYGGPSSHFWGIIKHLPQHFNQLHVIIPEGAHGDIGCPVHRVKKSGRISLAFSMAKTARRVAAENDISLFYTRSLLNSIALKPRKGHLILEINGIWSHETRQHIPGLRGKLASFVVSMMEKKAIKKASACIAVTEGIVEHYVSRGMDGKKFFVVENGVDPELFKPLNGERSRYGLRHDEEVIMFAGKFYGWQGVDIL